jgi:endonuclease YncB( thermonuclease family)
LPLDAGAFGRFAVGALPRIDSATMPGLPSSPSRCSHRCCRSRLPLQWQGLIVGVATATPDPARCSKTRHRIRLDGIDAPERSQPYGQRARQSLADLAHGRTAQAHCDKVDRYGRAVCRVTVDGVDVGLEQIKRGLAWHYVRYANEQGIVERSAYEQAERAARTSGAGLWSFRDPTPPWDYRRAQRGG